MKLILVLFPVFLFSQGIDFSEFNRVLNTYVNQQGFVNYKAIKEKENKTIQNLAKNIAEKSPKSHPDEFKSRDEKLVYWLNTYNLLIVKKIIDNYPTKSIKDIHIIGALVWTKGHDVGGKSLSFNDIEHEIIRKEFNEARIHFAINCASYGCPILQNFVFNVETLEDQLKEATADFYNSERHFKIDGTNKTIYLSAILDWFKEDFHKAANSENIIDFLIKYAPTPELRENLVAAKPTYNVAYMEYDWALNEQ